MHTNDKPTIRQASRFLSPFMRLTLIASVYKRGCLMVSIPRKGESFQEGEPFQEVRVPGKMSGCAVAIPPIPEVRTRKRATTWHHAAPVAA